MKKAVLDSSVLVSAFLSPGGTPAMLLACAQRGTFTIHLSSEILEKTTRALLRPRTMRRYRHAASDVAEYQLFLAEATEAVTDLPTLRAVPLDPKDDVIVATAVRADADYLVTGDRRHLVALGEYEGVRIVTPRQFLELLASD
jgi:putative PIN family toxin of toxin-antitoxin system